MLPGKSSRMDTGELKAQLFRKVGAERFKRYFFCLNRFINQKLSKSDFDRSCYRLLGRENLSLHNQIIRAILKNACCAKNAPPSFHEAGPAKPVVGTEMGLPVMEEGHGQATVVAPNQNSVGPCMPNGIVPISPRKVSSGARERKLRDRPSPLGLNGKVDIASRHLIATDDSGVKITENGDLAEQLENGEGAKQSPHDPFFVGGKYQTKLAVIEDREEMEEASELKISKSPLVAPLGIPFCSASSGRSRKSLPVMNIGDYVSCFDITELSDSDMLRRRMEQIADAQGLGGVTMECANNLNNMLDVYLKKLIRSCLDLVGARSTSDTSTYAAQKQQTHSKLINGLWPSNHLHLQNGGAPIVEEHRGHRSVSMLDFKVAMELNPQQLGEDWPLLLEKISMQAFEE